MPSSLFTPFKSSISALTPPDKFTFPFYYQPHPLAVVATQELQEHLEIQQIWQHDFGLQGESVFPIGKMFGVLVVENQQGELGYLSAFSGKLAEQNNLPYFVPPVFDMLVEDNFFLTEQKVINQVTAQLETLQQSPKLAELKAASIDIAQQQQQALSQHRDQMIEGRRVRKLARAEVEQQFQEGAIDEVQLKPLMVELSRQSVTEKNQLKALKQRWQQRIDEVEQEITQFEDEIKNRKQQRKTLSNALQYQLFEQYSFLNQQAESQTLNQIFKETVTPIPPAGAGECAAPKLLQYAFKNQLKPIALAEFWWGSSPKSEVRKHKNYYPSCQSKCLPILTHMLKGMDVDDNPLLVNPAEGKTLPIIYQDEALLIVNKPAEFLSVPGKQINDSVYHRIKIQFPEATGPLIVHRLDMSTSGLMVLALTKESHKNLQQQFIKRTVEKRYLARLEGTIIQSEGYISLPLRVDLEDRPKQLVCYQHGRQAETYWQVKGIVDGKTDIYLYPKTGRTHQLRVHCAHQLGLNTPIIGDDLYGTRERRLHLHAESLSFDHPESKQRMDFQVDADF
ncbi:pseudouridine synthase [Vibrio sp. SS-MA-C1-2]|uniref:RluA family pseudouridine synthase n=1 Tax=Vibrio sp. SS-MA-C1-2 TaxID=2908646 RepID=UPI001F1F262A|nr:RluA family pseudouridine synthase [Vibrio sp. SS-MA-C1-2]UJF18974.1 pseudouridine synthase [Vibrio sp. SS-MA-C1-2]